MKKYRIYQIDAFTKQLFRGNPAGVDIENNQPIRVRIMGQALIAFQTEIEI